MSSAAALAVLRKLHPSAIDLSLDRLEDLLVKCGSPEKRLPPVVHVAGTNGKGSTIAFVRAGLEADGSTVHAYTSPHLVSFHERIRVSGQQISEPALADLLGDLLRINSGRGITFFEATTCAALLAFSRAPADYTLLEVGMGGRLDATNVAGLAPVRVCVIAPVSLDHQDFLGETIEEIAAQKAGIMRPGVPCIVARQHPSAMRVIRDRAEALGCPLHVFGEDWSACNEGGELVFVGAAEPRTNTSGSSASGGSASGGSALGSDSSSSSSSCNSSNSAGRLEVGMGGRLEHSIRLPLPRALLGAHQVENAGLAIATLRLLGHGSAKALSGAMLRAEWPGRMQRLDAGPLATAASGRAELWLDGGHNPAAGVALACALAGLPPRERTVFICAMLRTKDVRGFLSPLRAQGQALYAVPIPSEGQLALTPPETAEAARAVGFEAVEVGSPLEAVNAAIAAAPEASVDAPLRIVICGSLYLAGWVLQENGPSGTTSSKL